MPGIPRDIDFRLLDPRIVEGRSSPIISTEPALRGGARAGDGGSQPDPDPVGVIFADSFDDQPDWHSGMSVNDLGGIPLGQPDTTQRAITGHTMPNGWDYVYQNPTLAPSVGDADREEVVSILSKFSDRSRSGTGKCVVFQRVADAESGSWRSDGQLEKVFDVGFSEVYIEFWIQFQPGWTDTWDESSSKLFRISCWNGQEPISKAFPGGNNGPVFVWNLVNSTNYGARNFLTLRGVPWGASTNYYSPVFGNLPSNASVNWTSMLLGMGKDGTDPQIPDRINGGFLPKSGLVTHSQVFGNTGGYHKMAFYAKMNSAPGVADGVIKQWLNDEQIGNYSGIAMVPEFTDGITEMPKWNLMGFGGNDWFKSYPAADRVQEWYSIDDIVIRDSIPEELL